MGTGIYSLVAGLCLFLTFVLYLRMIDGVTRSEKRDIYVSPLQCSCLENLRDGGARWAAIYGVTQSWTRLK